MLRKDRSVWTDKAGIILNYSFRNTSVFNKAKVFYEQARAEINSEIRKRWADDRTGTL